jgi:SAM-dependent methyltransferase
LSDRIEQWNERYRAGEQVFDAPAPLVVQFAGSLSPGSALDLAAGPGRNALYLAARGWRVTAGDGSQVAIDLLLTRARERKLSIDARVADLEACEYQVPLEAFDLVLSCYYFQRSLIPGMKSALVPGGLLILIAHLSDANQPQGTPTRASPGEVRAFFQDWEMLHYREGDPGEPGHRHAVVELVARKPKSDTKQWDE